jgi:predicted outer membrane protein
MRAMKIGGIAALLAVAAVFVGTGGSASARGSGVSGLDEEWLSTSLQGDLFEVKGGQTASQNSSNSGVQQLGKKLMSDHKMSYADGSKLAKKLGVEVPKSPTYPQKWELGQVGKLSGEAFDQAYTSLEALDHMQDIKDAKGEIADGTNKMVIAIAKQDLAMYREHLALVKKTQQGI